VKAGIIANSDGSRPESGESCGEAATLADNAFGIEFYRHVGTADLRCCGCIPVTRFKPFASVEAANQLGFSQVSDLVTMLIAFGGQVLLGSVILVVGFWLANLAHSAVHRVGGDSAAALAGILRVAILGLVLAMGPRAMGIADDIVNMAFGLILGAVTVAFAVSYSLGGREAAGKHMEYWLSSLRKK